MKVIYTTQASASGGGRTGHSGTPDGEGPGDLSVTKPQGGDRSTETSPSGVRE